METYTSPFSIAEDTSQQNTPPLTLVLALTTLMLASTGSVCTIRQSQPTLEGSRGPVITVMRGDEGLKSLAIVHHDLLRSIRTNLRMNMTDLAGLLGVSRAALYGWLQGSKPRPDMLSRLWQLCRYSETIAALNIPRVELFLKVPLPSGTTVFQSLATDSDVLESISSLQKISDSQSDAARLLQLRGRSHTPRHEASDITRSFTISE